MKEEIVSYETARMAKEKGFDLQYLDTFYHDGRLVDDYLIRTASGEIIEAPTQSLLQKWLREKHDIHVYCTPSRHFIARDFDNYAFSVLYVDNLWEDDGSYGLYETALEAGLKYALNLIK